MVPPAYRPQDTVTMLGPLSPSDPSASTFRVILCPKRWLMSSAIR